MKAEEFNSKMKLVDGREVSIKTLTTEGQPNVYEVAGSLSQEERKELIAWLQDVTRPTPAFVQP